MKLSVCYIIENENNIFFKNSLKSALDIADEVVIIDGGSIDGTLEMIDTFNDERIKIIHKRYEHENLGGNGRQRNEYLKWATGDWILVLDADEIIDDRGFILKEIIKNPEFDAYNVKMVHFIDNFSTVDATSAGTPQFDPAYTHFVLKRFFKNKQGLYYPEVEHPVLSGDIEGVGKINKVIIYHLGYLKGQDDIIKKYRNHKTKSNIHTLEFLNWWKDAHLLGFYPRKPIKFEEITSTIIKEMIKNG